MPQGQSTGRSAREKPHAIAGDKLDELFFLKPAPIDPREVVEIAHVIATAANLAAFSFTSLMPPIM